MRTRSDPFAVAEGRLLLDDLPLEHLAAEREGAGAAWVIGAAAVRAALSSLGSAAALRLDALGPPALLAMAGSSGCWAAVTSRHELSLAMAAGFPGRRTVVRGRVKDDGLLADALAAGVAVIEPADEDEDANLRRIADGLGHAVPARAGAPPDAPAESFAACGGLLARVLRGAPAVALDAAWPVDEAEAAPRDGGAADVDPTDGRPTVWPLRPGPARDVTLEGLAGCGGPVSATLLGRLSRGEWALVAHAGAAAPRRPDLRHPEPRTVLVDGARWRVLERRPLPPDPEP